MKKKGQSTVEYILLVTAVLGVIIFLTVNTKTGTSPFQQKLITTVNTTMNGMEAEANKLTSVINQ